MLQDPEARTIVSVNLPHEWSGSVGLGQLQILGPDDVLGETGLGAEDRVQDQVFRPFVVEGGGERFEVGVGDQEMLQNLGSCQLLKKTKTGRN